MNDEDLNRTVCFCHCVSAATITAAIREGHRTIAQIQAETCASTGCGGCECEVQEILDAELAVSATAKPKAD